MTNLVFISGDFSSGTTLLFTLFRHTHDYYCLYEPLHEKLLEYLIYRLRPDTHHPFAEPYFTEYKHFHELPRLFKSEWGVSGLYLPSDAQEDGLYRYFAYLIGMGLGRKERVLIKENRITFRLGWLRSHFPQARIIHIYRDREEQWNSVVRRGQEYLGKEDIGQGDVAFPGFNIARWCEELKYIFPELDAINFSSGHERFCKLWELSLAENQHYADISVDLRSLTRDFDATIKQIGECVGYRFDADALRRFVVAPEQRRVAPLGQRSVRQRIEQVIDAAGHKYAKARLLARATWQRS